MKNFLLTLSFLLTTSLIFGQTVILDFEDAATSSQYQYFGSTLDGTAIDPVANPDMSGINTSDNVMMHEKPDGSETWAGAFQVTQGVALDFISSTQMCVDVYMPSAGNVALKLENSTTSGPNWIVTKDVATPNTWTQVCYDVAEASIEDPFQPAAGHSYPAVVVFFDFGTAGTGATYYFDNVITQGMGASEGDVSFAVDMNDYTEPFTTVYVSGTMNNWSGDGNPLEDADGDGIWTGTIADIPVGAQEFKFTVDNWAAQEQFTGGETCVVTDPSGQFTNRQLTVSGDATLPTYCFNSCYECGQGVRININVGTSHITVDPAGIFIAGGGNFGNPGDNPLNDDDGDGVWSISLEREIGFTSHFTFTNGACPDWSCKENIAGLPCADPDAFNDRNLLLDPVMADMEINTCFETCSDNTDCGGGVQPADVTFQVDMNGYPDAFTDIYLRGTFNGWGLDNPLTDAGNGIWETTVSLNPGLTDYKFNVDDSVWEEFVAGDPCTEDFGGFVNRIIEVEESTTVCYEWNSCNSCLVGTNDFEVDETLFTVTPTLVNDYTLVNFNDEIVGEKTLRVFNATGILLEETTFENNVSQYEIQTGQLAQGIYLIYVQSGNKIATKKIVKQ